jgi:hypothetical protein
MEHTLRLMRITITLMGVFMTASEANRQRVITLLRVEHEQLRAEFNSFYKECPAVNRGEWSPSETLQFSTVDHLYSRQLNAS